MAANPEQHGLYSISTVSSLTGVNTVTLRAWERRYGLLKPTRTESGHRLYTGADIEYIKNILKLLDEGIAISRVTEAMRQAQQHSETITTGSDPWLGYRSDMLNAVANFDEATLESVYNQAMSLYSVDMVTSQLLLPLLKALGGRWLNEPIGVAEEHFFSIFMRNKLGARFHHRNLQNNGPRLLAACLPGEHHEFGLLLLALSAHSRGYRLILLGADMPLAQLPEVAVRTHSEAIVLSGSVDTVNNDLDDELRELVKQSKLPVFIGGSFAHRHRQSLEALGTHPIGDDLIVGLHALAQVLSPPASQQ